MKLKPFIVILAIFFSTAGCGEIGELKELLNDLKVENEKLLSELDLIKNQLDDYEARFQVIITGIKDNNDEIQSLKVKMDSLTTQLLEQLSKIEELKAQLTEQGANVEDLHQEILALKLKCEELRDLIEKFLDKIKSSCNNSFSDNFSSGLDSYTISSDGIIEVQQLEGNDVLYMSHLSGQAVHNFYQTDLIVGNGTYKVSAYNTSFITDHKIRLLEDESIGSGISLNFRPNGTDNPGFSIGHGGQVFYSSNQIPVNRGTWYDIRIELDSENLIVYLNDEQYYSVDRNELGFTDRSEGYFKLGTVHIGYFDDLSFECN